MPAANLGDVAERLRKATVHVHSRDGRYSGSGVIWSRDGLVVTNAHVAGTAETGVTLWDGRTVAAETRARDRRADLASLRIPARDLPAAQFRDSAGVLPGEVVLAVGNPLGFTGALSTGVVHGVGPVAGLGQRTWIQAAVRLAPGNSGGPLADGAGKVIGVNSMVYAGLGLAVPSNTMAQFMERGPRKSRVLGVTVRPVPVAWASRRRLRRDARHSLGLLVLEVAGDGLAASVSLRPGDLLISAGGRPFSSLDELHDALDSTGPLPVEFLRPPGEGVRRVTIPPAHPLSGAA